jgi:hypothetical protein
VTVVLVSLLATACVCAAAGGVLALGLRAGDRFGDAIVETVVPDRDAGVISFTVHNPGEHAVLVGASVRRRCPRMWFEAGSFVSVPRRTARRGLLASHHSLICAVDGQESHILRVPLSHRSPSRAELVIAIGELDRLRVIHRTVVIPRNRRVPGSAERVSGDWPGRVPLGY